MVQFCSISTRAIHRLRRISQKESQLKLRDNFWSLFVVFTTDFLFSVQYDLEEDFKQLIKTPGESVFLPLCNTQSKSLPGLYVKMGQFLIEIVQENQIIDFTHSHLTLITSGVTLINSLYFQEIKTNQSYQNHNDYAQ